MPYQTLSAASHRINSPSIFETAASRSGRKLSSMVPDTESRMLLAGLPPIDSLQGPDLPLAELEDLPGTLAMLQEVGLT